MSERIVFGEVTLREAEGIMPLPGAKLVGDSALIDAHPAINPCVRVFGVGAEGVLCKTCSHLERWNVGTHNVYKCNLRPYSHGPGTDHRMSWPSCTHYEERIGELETGYVPK